MEKKFFGREKVLDIIRAELSNFRESSSFNIIGNYGSGRSGLLRTIEDRIKHKEWKFPQTDKEPIVIINQGDSFYEGDNLVDFLGKQMVDKILQATKLGREVGDSLPDVLSAVAALDYPVVIMVDNFTRIMKWLDGGKVHGLNRLRPAGVHYVLVSDHRALEEINSQVFGESEFFKFTRRLHLKPLGEADSLAFIKQCMEEYALSDAQKENRDKLISTIAEIAGGLPGLLTAVTQYFIVQMRDRNFDGNVEKGNSRTVRLLRYLPIESGIQYYLNLLLTTIQELTPVEKQMLIKIALEHESMNIDDIDVNLENKFRIMGLLSPDSIRISGKLMQYTILNNVVSTPFSGAEQKVFDKFVQSRPGLTTFEEIDTLLKDETEKFEDPANTRQYIDSTVARIRKKIKEAMLNQAAFAIINERGLGFTSRSEVSFDEFYFNEPSIFSKSK